VPTVLILALNGLYLGPAFRLSPALFWVLDTTQFVSIPLLSCWALRRFAQVSPQRYGLGRLVHDEDPISALLLFGFVMFIFTFGYPFSRGLAGYVPWFWDPSSFSYGQAVPINPALAIVTVVFFSFSAGLVEEVFFRGLPALYLEARLSPQRFKLIYPLVSALAFALIHWENGSRELIATFLLGLLAAYFYLLVRNIWPFVVGHAFTDIFGFVGVYDF
jgi:membrane protease YdiL (CAAX protease family)